MLLTRSLTRIVPRCRLILQNSSRFLHQRPQNAYGAFKERHIGPREDDKLVMLNKIGFKVRFLTKGEREKRF